MRECARLEWRVGDGGDPAVIASSFLARYGLGVPVCEPSLTERDGVLGAALFVSAAAGASMIGVRSGVSSPAPAVPDLAIVVYEASPEPAPQPPSAGAWRLGTWAPSWSPREHAAAVSAVREAIARGDVYQVNLVGHASAPYVGDPGPALDRVTRLPGARYPYQLRGDGWAIACASPETLVRVGLDGGSSLVETLPIKGTRPATSEGRRELLVSLKERAEHVMIVDLERNDLARIARTGSVRVPTLFEVRRWCDLWQAESRVVADLADGVGLADLLRAMCPGGSVTGAPKLAALAQIAALEPVGRGPSMGALGWLDRTRIDLGLTIRTVAVDADRVHLWAGGGITWDSEPDAVVAEAAAKAAPLRSALTP